jgi:hypothetical protein
MTSVGGFPPALRSAAVHLPWGATIVVVSGSADAELLKTMLLLKRSGFSVSLILVQPDHGALTGGAARIPVQTVWNESDVESLR